VRWPRPQPAMKKMSGRRKMRDGRVAKQHFVAESRDVPMRYFRPTPLGGGECISGSSDRASEPTQRIAFI
jgi:hypothetical protein